MLIVTDHIKIPYREILFTFARSSGPGGQKVNKTSSKVLLEWNILTSPSQPAVLKSQLISKLSKRLNSYGAIQIQSDRFRDRNRNIDDALEKLKKIILHAAHTPKIRIKTKPKLNAREKRLQSKRFQSEKKQSRKKIF